MSDNSSVVYYTCTLPPGTTWRPDPFPGSLEAWEAGCTCPAEGQDWPRTLIHASDCKVHELEEVVD